MRFSDHWWGHGDLILGINSYVNPCWPLEFQLQPVGDACPLIGQVFLNSYPITLSLPLLFNPQGYCRHGPGGRAGGRAGGCQTCGTHISVTAGWIFSVWSSMELSRPVVVHCHAHLPICPIWARPWAENLSNLPQIGSRLCGSHISETAGWIYPISSFMDLSRPVVVYCHSYLPICHTWVCPSAKNLSNQAALGPDFAEPISLEPLDGFIPFEVLWNCLDL